MTPPDCCHWLSNENPGLNRAKAAENNTTAQKQEKPDKNTHTEIIVSLRLTFFSNSEASISLGKIMRR